uniref:Capsid protein n=1 Tax=Anelloviridae sp. TaxID=2055263 RepID=A0A2H4R0K1_9VIRU|nr:ORF1 [Anelloviridae sp.]
MMKNRNEFNPVQRYFADPTGTLQMGGWAIGNFSLYNMYTEHQAYRNRWSYSNCGFDLARYSGTTLYFEQHFDIDYMVFIDPEYETIKAFAHQATFHPLSLITHPQTIMVKSRARAGPRRARKVWVPRPSWWDSGWDFSKNIANKGIFSYFICMVDLDWPMMQKIGRSESDMDNQNVSWWKDKNLGWKAKFDKYVTDCVSTPYKDKNHTMTQDDLDVCGWGPFFLRPGTSYLNQNRQLLMFYKSVWHWGGRNMLLKKVCDPSKDLHN